MLPRLLEGSFDRLRPVHYFRPEGNSIAFLRLGPICLSNGPCFDRLTTQGPHRYGHVAQLSGGPGEVPSARQSLVDSLLDPESMSLCSCLAESQFTCPQ